MSRVFLIFLCTLLPLKQLYACAIDIYANEKMKPKAYLENGQAKGILIEMMDYIGADIDCKFTYHFSTWARAYKSMMDNKGGAIGLSWTQSRSDIIDFSDVMYNEDILLVSNIKTPIDYTGLQDLAGKTLGASRNAKFGGGFEKALNEHLFTYIGDNGDPLHRLKRVAKGRLDVAIIYPGLTAFNNIFAKNQELLDIKAKLHISKNKFMVDPNYLGFAKSNDHKDFLKKFNLSMKKARKAGIFKAIEDKYPR